MSKDYFSFRLPNDARPAPVSFSPHNRIEKSPITPFSE